MAKKTTVVKCIRCEKDKISSDFYEVNSFVSSEGYLKICKRCIKEMYEMLLGLYHDYMFSLIHLCILLNFPFDLETAKKTLDKELPQDTVLLYFNVMDKKNGRDRVSCLDRDTVKNIVQYSKENNLEDLALDEYLKDFKVTREIITRWGDSYDKKELYFLEDEYKKLIDYYGTGSPTQQRLYKDYAIGNLKLQQCLAINDDENYMKFRKAQSTLMKDAGLKPKEKEDVNEDELLVGLIAKKIEETKPIVLKDDKYKDIDEIRKTLAEEYVLQLGKCIGKV